MKIKTCPLDPGLTIAEVVLEDGSAWHFLPFEDRTAKLYALDERYIVAFGPPDAVAIFDSKERRRTILITKMEYVADSWCFREICGSLFLQEWVERPYHGRGEIALRKISADGSHNQRVGSEIDMSVSKLLVRSDGSIVLVGRRQNITFDPDSNEFRVWPFGEHERAIDLENLGSYRFDDDRLRWFSGDGEFGIRLKLKPEIIFKPSWRQRSKFGMALSRLLERMGFLSKADCQHPDLPGDGTIQHGLAVEILQLAPVKLVKTVVVRYFPAKSFDMVFWRRYDRSTQSGGEQVPKPKTSEDWRSVTFLYPPALHLRIDDVEWQPKSKNFKFSIVEAVREVPSIRTYFTEQVQDLTVRTVSLDGEVGPIERIAGEATPVDYSHLPSDIAIKALQKFVREKSTQKIECSHFNEGGVAQALNAMTSLINTRKLDDLVFGEQLRFKFRVEGRFIGEKKFFDRVRKMPSHETPAILQPLRDLIAAYGAQARKKTKDGVFPISNSPSEQASAALSDAALTLAVLDDSGFDALRDWVISVDQEHDVFAARKVFPAFVKTTGFKSAASIRFGIWFFFQQWQTVPYEKKWFNLFAEAPKVLAPEQFAKIVVEEMSSFEHFSEEPIDTGLEHIRRMLSNNAWTREAIAEVERLSIDA